MIDNSWRTPLAERVKTATGYNNIYEYQHFYGNDVAKFESLFKDDAFFGGGWLDMQKSIPTPMQDKVIVTLDIFTAWRDGDASTIEFDNMLLALQADFKVGNRVANWVVVEENKVPTWQMITKTPATVGNVFCHLAKLQISLIR